MSVPHLLTRPGDFYEMVDQAVLQSNMQGLCLLLDRDSLKSASVDFCLPLPTPSVTPGTVEACNILCWTQETVRDRVQVCTQASGTQG